MGGKKEGRESDLIQLLEYVSPMYRLLNRCSSELWCCECREPFWCNSV